MKLSQRIDRLSLEDFLTPCPTLNLYPFGVSSVSFALLEKQAHDIK